MIASKKQSQSLLFTLDPPLPPEITAAPPAPVAQEARREAQTKFADFIKKSGKSVPLLVARFIARQVQGETQKLVQATHPGASAVSRENDFTDAESGVEKYVLADHLERLRYLEMVPSKEEADLLVNVLRTALPGLEEFITAEKYATLTGKMAYNSFGVCFGGGRDDKVRSSTHIFTFSFLNLKHLARTHCSSRRRGKDSYTLRYPASNW
jgi:import receptor subunit TOM20